MLQQQQRLLKAPKGNVIDSFLISIFDGTGSMNYEYAEAVQAHNKVFGYKGNKKEEYQFTEELHESFLPFKCSGSGNITNAFNKILNKLLANQEKYQKYISIIFLSDGEEQFELEKLENLIEEVKKIFHIKFISVAVGQYFPHQISNDLRKKLHTEDDSTISMKSVKRDPNLSEQQVQQKFRQVFSEINQFINFQEGTLQVNQPVKQHILAQETNFVLPNQIFQADVQTTPILINGQLVEEIKDKRDVEEYIEKSVHVGFIQGTNDTYQELFNKIQKGISDIFNHYPKVQENPKDKGQIKLKQVLVLVDSIVQGDLHLEKLTNDQKTKMQEGLFSNEVNLITEVIKCGDHVKTEELTEELIIDRLKEKYKQIKAGCIVRGRRINDQVQERPKLQITLKQVFDLVLSSLNEAKQFIQNNPEVDPNKVLSQFKDRSFEQMNQLFKAWDFKIEEESEIIILKQLNYIFESIHKFAAKELTLVEFVNLKFQIEETKDTNQETEFSAFFQENKDFQYLPHELNLLYQEGNQLEEAQKVFVLLVDQSPSMVFEEKAVIQVFQEVFENIAVEKKIVLTFKGKQVFFNNTLQQTQGFESLFMCLKSIEAQYQLKQRRISICLVTDGKGEDYKIIHKQFKIASFSYSIRVIYFTIGGLLQALIDENIKKKYQNRNVKGCPKLVNVPRKLVQTKASNNDLKIQLRQRFEDLLKEFI